MLSSIQSIPGSDAYPDAQARSRRTLKSSMDAAQRRTYNKRIPGGLGLLCSLSGSGFPRALPFGIVAGVACAMLELYADIDGFNLFEHTYPFHVIAFITGFGLIFRLNIAYQRYWAGRRVQKPRPACTGPPSRPSRSTLTVCMPKRGRGGALVPEAVEAAQTRRLHRLWPLQEARSLTQSMAAKWADAALQVIAFDEAAEGEAAESSPAFVTHAVHAFSLLHATALQVAGCSPVSRGCSPVQPRLQLRVPEAATPCLEAAAPCNRGCSPVYPRLRPRVSRLQPPTIEAAIPYNRGHSCV